MSEQSVRQAARGRSALNAQAVLRERRADRERRAARGVAEEVLTALGEPDRAPGTRSDAPAARCWR